ncbi:hypothetical protein CC80DRAFT_598005 [Byssothecium circinans]|uniref:WSC domain-containing protein n=1 Tax=Byssothecium circinans TaxID=147558 RepID=A0A6A5TP94_9PLEO|nr:hypothetical protein CC80DRAFT_598005 [Byssothecium circinans]
MKASTVIFASFLAAASASSMSEHEAFFNLLKRQEPGSPAYNCHNNCGTAITISKSDANVCSNEAFKSGYANCLQCAGPDNFNIWRIYGRTLTPVGSKCGLSTTPLSGKQPDVPDAKPASSGSSSSSVSSAASSPATSVASSSVVSSTPTSAATSSPSPSGNLTTSPIPPPPQQTTNGAAGLQVSGTTAGIFGFVVMGAMYFY